MPGFWNNFIEKYRTLPFMKGSLVRPNQTKFDRFVAIRSARKVLSKAAKTFLFSSSASIEARWLSDPCLWQSALASVNDNLKENRRLRNQ